MEEEEDVQLLSASLQLKGRPTSALRMEEEEDVQLLSASLQLKGRATSALRMEEGKDVPTASIGSIQEAATLSTTGTAHIVSSMFLIPTREPPMGTRLRRRCACATTSTRGSRTSFITKFSG